MNPRLRSVFILAGGLFLGLILGGFLLFLSLHRDPGNKRPLPPTTGEPMADFSLTGLDRRTVRLSDLKGKPVVLNFWATWCPPCREEMPLFEKYSREYRDQVTVVGVNYGEDAVTVQNFVAENKITFPIWLDPKGEISDLYYIDSYPSTFFIDGQGILRARHIGQLDEDLLKKYLAILKVTP
ncbi:peroxiredoxin [Anaerolinea thermolimosa]|uniref:TlpA family protein disulfide reductase n=1 Tax=Anaerolinea thermolimosa TaxID=229919 RepID=UPI000782224D|nr:TlpA disulfide reductase family protein [Anaerolinea thermolimosa]GAP06659.1 peroxiredoxin [Anaerolinea thermolimosa]